MGFVDIHVHGGLEDATLSVFSWAFSRTDASSEAADEESASDRPERTVEEWADGGGRSGRSPKLAAVGLLVVIGFLIATGLLVKRRLDGDGGPEDDLDVV